MSDNDTINALVAEYQRLIGPIHHKDRDCHFRISKVWSYGAKPTYEIEHNGYLFDEEISGWKMCSYDTNAEAMEALEVMLRFMVAITFKKRASGDWE